MIESSKLVQKTERDLEGEIRTQCPTDYDRKRLKVKEQYHCYKKSKDNTVYISGTKSSKWR